MITILIGIVVWMFIGNIWVDLLNGVSKQLDGEDVGLLNRLINSALWPYSIYTFMSELRMGFEEKNRGDIPAITDTLMNMVDSIDRHVAGRLNTDLDTYRETIDTKCTDEEVDDIVTTVINSGDEMSDELKRVMELYNSKLK